MTIVGTHRGAVSGKVHVHLLRESAAERAAKAAAQRKADAAAGGIPETSAADPSIRGNPELTDTGRRQADAAAGTRPETSAADRSTAIESGSNDSTGPQHWFG